MDHFSGFDRLLRVCLNRTLPLHVMGPAGFVDRVEHKLRSYTLNLLGEHSPDFVIIAAEFEDDGVSRACEFRARDAFVRREAAPLPLPRGTLLDEEAFRVTGTVLDHGTACLAFAFEEKLRVNVWSEGLKQLQLPVGPWLKEAKQLVRRGAADDTEVVVGGERSISLGALKQTALRTGRGQKVAYVVDAAGHDRNVSRIIALARDADQLFIEAAFMDADAEIAAQRQHLTARRAGEIGKLAGAKRLIPFHFSARSEAERAFRGR
jgi:ribonuclease Z